jgi:hypothetical protein
MKEDCIHFDTCDVAYCSACCGSAIEKGDICHDCGEHCDSFCTECIDYESGNEKEPTEDDIKRSIEEHKDRLADNRAARYSKNY